MKRVLGAAGYFRSLLKDYAKCVAPLEEMTAVKVKFEWNEERENAFQELQKSFFEKPMLRCPDFKKKFVIQTDASKINIAGVLMQEHDGLLLPISYFSKKLNTAQSRYHATKLELFAVISTIRHFRDYLLGTKFVIMSDHKCLKYGLKIESPTNAVANWLLELSTYEYKFIYLPGEENILPDYLSRMELQPSEGTENENNSQTDRLKREPPTRKEGQIRQKGKLNSEDSGSNNGNLESINILTVQEKVIELTNERILEEQLGDSEILRLREEIKNQKLIPKRNLDSFYVDKETDLLMHIRLEQKRDKEAISTIVIPRKLQKLALELVHYTHLGISKSYDLLRRQFFWPGAFADVKNYILSCDTCGRVKLNKQRHLPHGKVFIPRIPADVLFIDIVYAKESNVYILTIVCQFTKLLQAYILTNMKAVTVAEKLVGYFTTFSKPRRIQTDLGTNFTSEIFAEINKIFGVNLTHSLAYTPNQNGIVERSHLSLKQTLAALKLQGQKLKWAVKFHVSFYNNTIHSATNAIPSEVYFGRKLPFLLGNNLDVLEETNVGMDAYLFNLKETVKKVYENVTDSLTAAQNKQISDLRQKSTKAEFKIGQTVFVKDNGIFAKGFHGPYVVKNIVSPTVVTIQDEKLDIKYNVSTNKLKFMAERRQHLM